MKQKLKNLFSKASKKTKKNTVIFAASATMMLGGGVGIATQMNNVKPSTRLPAASASMEETATPLKTGLNDGAAYWKHKDYDMIVKTWPCEERGLCASIYSVNERDASNRELMAELKGYRKAVRTNFGGKMNSSTRYVADPDRVQDWEINAYCGYQADINLTKKDNGAWTGTITSPFNGGTYGLDIKQLDNGQVKGSAYLTGFPLFWLSEKADRVDTPPPACKFSWPDP